MDLRLPLLADANLHLSVAEDAYEEGSMMTARNELDKAEAALAELRLVWPGLGQGEQGLLSAMAAPIRARLDALSAQVRYPVAVSQGEPEPDGEEEQEPELR